MKEIDATGEKIEEENDTIDFKPEDGFSLEFVYDMIFNIHFRERWMRFPESDLITHAIELERNLFDTELNYQSITVKEDSQTV